MWVLGFAAPEIAEGALPGQFVNLGLRPGPLLRRPFSVYRAERGTVEILLRDVGAGTSQLLALALGERVSVLGPLGTGFHLEAEMGAVALLSGGLGAAPFPLVAKVAGDMGLSVFWAHGARTATELSSEWYGDRVIWATDDGSRGHHGSVLDAIPAETGAILACGPNPMLAAVAARWPAAQVAVETYMACGTGVCLGCAVPLTVGGYDRACREGPVYRASDVDWAALPSHLSYAVSR